MNPRDFNRQRYEETWKLLNEHLEDVRKKEGLAGALEALYQQQMDSGFILDDLKQVIRYHLYNPEYREHRQSFTVQYNPRRAERGKGAGRKSPPEGVKAVNDGCFLCKENIRWQQRGTEFGYEITVNETQYVAWMNPFPLMPVHATIATKEHTRQTWISKTPEESEKRIRGILADLLDVSGQLPGFIGFYNGEGAGASIPTHFHFQFFKRPQGQPPFSLEVAAARKVNKPPFNLTERDYPIACIYFRGRSGEILEQAVTWVCNWTRFCNHHEYLSANIIAIKDTEAENDIHLYFVPRNKYFSHAPGMQGIIGGLEVLGELVFCQDVEKEQLIDLGRVDYQFVKCILHSVEAPSVHAFLKRAGGY